MSRLYRPFRTLFGSARIASRLQSGQTVRIERVKIKKGRPATRFLGTVFKGALIFHILVFAASAASAPQDRTGQDGSGRRREQEGRFIPFPLTTKRHPPEPYSASDPEWKEFIRISKDPNETKEMRHYMAGLVLKSALNNPVFTAKFGNAVRIRQYWLEIHYPLRAPPVYERSGLLITDDAVAWATTTCDSWTVSVLDHFLWPKPLALGSWAFGTMAVKETARDVARYFGFSSEESGGAQGSHQNRPSPPSSSSSPPPLPSSPGPEVQKELQRLRQEATRRPQEVSDPSSLASSAGATPAAPSTPRDKAMSVSDKPAIDQSNQGTPEQQKSWVEDMILSFSNSQPWKKLKETYQRERRLPRPDPPRGCVIVTGLVQLETTRGWVTCELLAYYDPKTKAYAPGTTRISVWRVQAKQQAPLRK